MVRPGFTFQFGRSGHALRMIPNSWWNCLYRYTQGATHLMIAPCIYLAKCFILDLRFKSCPCSPLNASQKLDSFFVSRLGQLASLSPASQTCCIPTVTWLIVPKKRFCTFEISWLPQLTTIIPVIATGITTAPNDICILLGSVKFTITQLNLFS